MFPAATPFPVATLAAGRVMYWGSVWRSELYVLGGIGSDLPRVQVAFRIRQQDANCEPWCR